MSNGSFLTSQLPITSNAVGSDRLLILWNAIANVSVGSGSPQTMMIGMSDFVNSALATIETDIMTSAALSLGNSTVNTAINSTSLYIQTNTGIKFAVNTSGVIIGNGAGLTSIGTPGSNTQIVFNNSGSQGTDATFTWNTASEYLTIGNGSVNAVLNSTAYVAGNAYINTTTLAVGNAGSVFVGNATYNTVITPQSVTISNNGVIVYQMTGSGAATLASSILIGNSSVNVYIVPTSIQLGSLTSNPGNGVSLSSASLLYGNTILNSQVNSTAFAVISNTTANSIHSQLSLIFNSNATINSVVNGIAIAFGTIGTTIGSVLTNTSLTIGNSSVNTFLNDQSALITGNTTVNTTVNSTVVALGTVATTVGMLISNSSITIGNSTVNNILGAASLALGVVGATSGALLNNTSITLGNSTVNTTANSTHFFSGNSTVFGYSNSTAEMIANSTGNSITTPLSVSFQTNSSSNGVLSNSSLTFNSNSTVNSSLTALALAWGGTSYTVVPPPASILTANFAMTSAATAQNTFPSPQRTVTLAAATTYLFEGQYAWTYSNATNINVAIAFGNSAAIGVLSYRYTFFANNLANSTVLPLSGYAGSNAAMIYPTTISAITNNASVFFKGYLTTAGAVNITPQFQTVTATGNAPSMLAGSFIKFMPVGNATISTIGTWT
jgi:hypothetical protein